MAASITGRATPALAAMCRFYNARMDPSDSADSFIVKWQARWPEWSMAMAFVPLSQRNLVAAWFALMQELTDAAWGGDDPTPGLAKLAWWQEELLGWSKGARRHPLGTALQPVPAPWATLARGLPSLQASRGRPGESATGDVMTAFANAVAECESALFGTRDQPAIARPAEAVKYSLLGEQWLFHPQTARANVEQADGVVAATRARRLHAGLVRAALVAAAHTRTTGTHRSSPLSPWRALLVAWRAARGR